MTDGTLKFVVQLGVALVAAYTAWEARNKKRRLESLAESQMQHQAPLRAAIESQENGVVLTQFGTVTREGDMYRLEIRRDAENGPLEIQDTFSNLDALESYLAEKTIFRFGDFVAR